MSTANSLAPGSIVGSYQIIDMIAQGGMGIVYRAQHRILKREAALKILFPHLAADSEFTQRFLREGMAMGQLRHPNIVEVYDANVADGYYYLAIEYLPGGTLSQQMNRFHSTRQFMPVNDALKAIQQVALALNYAHSKGFVHRDIKPSNIMIAADGRYVVTDFGIVHAEGATKLTRSVEAMGTPEYMSPEQAQGMKVDGRSDIYSLGIVLYEMLTGKPPFVADTPWGTVYKHIKEPPTPITRVRTDLPGAVVEIANKTIAKKPEDRFQTAGELAAAIDGITKPKMRGGNASESFRTGVTTGTGGSNRLFIIGGIAVLLVVVVAAIVFVASTLLSPTTPPAAQSTLVAAAVTATRRAVATTAPAQTEQATVVDVTTQPTGTDQNNKATATIDSSSNTDSATATSEGATASAPPTATPPAPASVKASATTAPPETPIPQKTLAPTNTSSPGAAPKPGQLFDFEQAFSWRIGDQPYGSLEQSNAQSHDGAYSAKLTYDIPGVSNAFVVFLNDVQLPGQPTGLLAWVYGDGSGHFLNTWIGDANGQVRQYTFGRVFHAGWQQMIAWFDDTRPWPNTYISGPDNGKLSYPITFKALVLDAAPHGTATKGAIYIDEVTLTTQSVPASGATPIPAAAATASGAPITGTASAQDFSFGNYTIGRQQWGKPTSADGCGSFSNDNVGLWLKYEINFDIVNSGQSDISNWSPVFLSNIRNVLPTCVNKAGSTTISVGASTHVAYTLYMTGQYLETIEVKTDALTKKLCVDAYGKTITPC